MRKSILVLIIIIAMITSAGLGFFVGQMNNEKQQVDKQQIVDTIEQMNGKVEKITEDGRITFRIGNAGYTVTLERAAEMLENF